MYLPTRLRFDMTQEDVCTRLEDELHSSSENASEEDDVVVRPDRASVKEMILRFEKTSINNNFGDSCESLEKMKDPLLGSLTSVVNPIHVHFQHLCPVSKSQDRNSNVSVNSILSNVSEISYESSSSGFISDRKSDVPVPHRPAPPPPAPFNDSSLESKFPVPHDEVTLRERRFSFTTPNTSPIVVRRSKQPPIVRRKSLAGRKGHLGDRGDTLWSYGVTQSNLEKLLRLKRSEPSDTEEEPKYAAGSDTDSSSSSSNDSDKSDKGEEYIVSNDDGRTDTLSTDHSTDTLINEEDSDAGDNVSVTSGLSGERSNYDNVSIKSISSFDMVPYQKYDSITVSSDEFGSELCHAPDTEFLTVSAVNEWCLSKSVQPLMIPVESKKEKYRR